MGGYYSKVKKVVRAFYGELAQEVDVFDIKSIFQQYTVDDYHWRGMCPFYELKGTDKVVDEFYAPLIHSFLNLQRREDIFFAGSNDCDDFKTNWTVSMGHFMGIFQNDWIGIPATGKMTFIRYAEFHRVNVDGKIVETALFLDILNVMHQAGKYPLPPMTGSNFLYPGPRTHDGLLFENKDSNEGKKTLELVNRMIADLNSLNKSGEDRCPPEFLERCWSKNMIWYGPTGIGATYTISHFQNYHQYPFRENLINKNYYGHIARLAEGNYCGFFGWSNLSNQNNGGFLGLPKSDVIAPMRIVDIYRRENDKLVENWVFLDMLHYLNKQGLDVLKRMKELK